MYEKLEDEIVSLIEYYIKNNKIVDEYYIKSIVLTYINVFMLNKYVSDVFVSDTLNVNCFGTFGMYYNKISIYLKKRISYLWELINNFKLSPRDKNYFMFLEITKVILHELEHALQFKKIDLNNSDIETKILKANNSYIVNINEESNIFLINYIKKNNAKKEYKKYYLYNPAERLAEYNARYTILNVASKLDMNKDIMCLEELFFIKFILSAYQKTNNPTLHYFDEIGYSYINKKLIVLSNEYDLEKRLRYGLDLKEEEKNMILERGLDLKRKICI